MGKDLHVFIKIEDMQAMFNFVNPLIAQNTQRNSVNVLNLEMRHNMCFLTTEEFTKF